MSQIAKDLLEQLIRDMPTAPPIDHDVLARRKAVADVLGSVGLVLNSGGRVIATAAEGRWSVRVDGVPIVELKEQGLSVAIRSVHAESTEFELVERLSYDKRAEQFNVEAKLHGEDTTDVVVREIVERIRAWMPR